MTIPAIEEVRSKVSLILKSRTSFSSSLIHSPNNFNPFSANPSLIMFALAER